MEYCCMYYKLHVTVHVLSTMLSFLLQDLVTLHRRQEECPPYLLYWGGHPHPLPEPPRVLYYLPMHEGLYKVFWVGCEFHCLDEADCMGDILVYFSNSWPSLMVPQCSFSYLSDTKLSYCMTCSFTFWILFCWGVGCCLFCMIMIMKYLFSWFFFSWTICWFHELYLYPDPLPALLITGVLTVLPPYVHINDAIVLIKRSLF